MSEDYQPEQMWRVYLKDAKTGYFYEAHRDCVTREVVAQTVCKARKLNAEVKVLDFRRFVMLTPQELESLSTTACESK